MIQATGHLKNENPKAIAAAQKILFDMGYSWLGKNEVRYTRYGNLNWDENKYLSFSSESNFFLGILHSLSDFNLDEEGNELPKPLTMQDIKVGGTYRVREDLETGEKYNGVVFTDDMMNFSGKTVTPMSVTLTCFDIKEDCGEYAWTPEMLKRLPQQPHTYQFGDKVKVEGNTKARMYLGMIKEMVLYCIDDTDAPWQNRVIYNCPFNHITPWPESVSIDAGLEWPVVLDHEGAAIGCNTVSPEAMDEIAETWLKIRNNE